MASDDTVARWNISLADGRYIIEFEHGTTSGRRVVRVNNKGFKSLKEIKRENWMFKLVGQEMFSIGNGKHKCVINIESASGFTYEYTLEVDGKSYEKFVENQSKILQAWTFIIHDVQYRIALEKNTMDIWVNGERVDVDPQFIENGTETIFKLGGVPIRLVTVSSGNRRSGLVHALFVNNKEIAPSDS